MDIQATFNGLTWLTKDVVLARFGLEKPLPFEAGQFVMINFQKDGKKIPKAYSLVNTPDKSGVLEFLMKYYPEGTAVNTLKALPAGSPLPVRGPFGKLNGDAHAATVDAPTPMTAPVPKYFIATGVGLAPLYSIILDELQNKKTTAPLKLIFGVRTAADVFYKNELDALAAAHPNFSYILTLSQPDTNWTGARGRVTEHVRALPESDLTGARAYLCGNPEMVKDVRAALHEQKNAPLGNIHFEVW